MRLRGPRSVAFGSAGAWLALALGAVAALTAFIAASGPRVLAAAQDRAIAEAIATVPLVDRAVVITGGWSGRPYMTPGQQSTFYQRVADSLPAPATNSLYADRGFVTGPPEYLPTAPRSAMLGGNTPEFQLTEDSELAADTLLVAGTLPGHAIEGVPGTTAADRAGLTLQVAVTPAIAAKFSLLLGSRLTLPSANGRLVQVVVTGIVRARPASLLAASGQAQLVPALSCLDCLGQAWEGGAVVGPAELPAMQAALLARFQGTWYLPIELSHITQALLGPTASAIDSLQSSGAAVNAAGFINMPQMEAGVSSAPATITSQLPAELATIQAQLSATANICNLIIGGIFAAELLLILLCAGLAADRYEPEFALLRARGSSLRQVTLRALARSASATVPGVVLGLVLAARIFRTPGATSAAAILPAVTVAIAVCAVPARSAWKLRSVTARAARRADIESPRRSPRRVIAETTLLVLTVGAVVALRFSGLGSNSDQLALATPILVATAASIAVARLYPIPVRALLPLARTGRGAVGFLGLTKAGRSGLATLLPALALVLTLTLAAFGWMLTQSVSSGQIASSWNQTGADAIITAPGNNFITASQAQAMAAVPGVTHVARVYTAVAGGNFTGTLTGPAGRKVPVGLAIVDPVPYAALSKDTPWPHFPAAALARRAGPVPILISAAAADSAAGSHQTLDIAGINLPVTLAGTITDTPAYPVGGTYVVVPQWAESQFPSIAGPATLLATGPGAASKRFAATAARTLRRDSLIQRARVLATVRGSAAKEAARLFAFGTWTAAALSALALLFGLAATAQSRRAMQTRLAALGMSARQARALALLDPMSLFIVGIVGMAASGAVLALISHSVVSIAPLTGPLTTAAVSLDLPAVAVPAAGLILLGLAMAATEHWLVGRTASATALKTEEAR